MSYLQILIHWICSFFYKPSVSATGAAHGKSWIVLHHWYGEPKTREEAYQICIREGFSDFPYNWIICRDGTLWQGRPETSCAANLGLNSKAVAICFLGNFQIQIPTIAQMNTAAKLIREMLVRHPRAKVILHRDVVKLVPLAWYHRRLVSTATKCPGDLFVSGKFGTILWKMVCGLNYEQARKKVFNG